MQEYSLQEAQTHLPELIAEAVQGKTVLIHGDGEKVVQLVPVSMAKKPRKIGSARGQIKMSDDFDAPLEDFNEYME